MLASSFGTKGNMLHLTALHTICLLRILTATALDCMALLHDTKIQNIEWHHMEPCLAYASNDDVSKNVSENVWRLTKNIFSGIENIPPREYIKLGYSLTAIPNEELRNISMDVVEVVEAFGLVRKYPHENNFGFTQEQMKIIAQKVRHEWKYKSPATYSEFDLLSMGEILCHLNSSDIEQIHADAYKAVAEEIGKLNNCPMDALRALAKLATSHDGFRDSKDWNEVIVSIVGDVINGLTSSDIAAIGNKIRFNYYYKAEKNSNKNKLSIKSTGNQVAQNHSLSDAKSATSISPNASDDKTTTTTEGQTGNDNQMN